MQAFADALQQRIVHTPVIMQSFSATASVRARASATGVDFEPTQDRSFSVMEFHKVQLSGQQVVATGTKRYLLRHEHTIGPSSATQTVELRIDVDPNLTRSAIADDISELFFASLQDALHAVPDDLKQVVPGTVDRPSKTQATTSQTTCDCNQHGTQACQNATEQGTTIPVLLKQVDPRMPPDTSPYVDTKTVAALHIDKAGHVGEIWMLYAPSSAFASASLAALREYRFKPPTCHSVPRDTYLTVDTNYRKY